MHRAAAAASTVSKDVPLKAQLMAAIREKDDDKVSSSSSSSGWVVCCVVPWVALPVSQLSFCCVHTFFPLRGSWSLVSAVSGICHPQSHHCCMSRVADLSVVSLLGQEDPTPKPARSPLVTCPPLSHTPPTTCRCCLCSCAADPVGHQFVRAGKPHP